MPARLTFAIVAGTMMLPLLGAEERPCVVAVDVDSVVHPVTVDILTNAIQKAGQERCRALLVRLNTPGGFSDATRAAVEKLVSSPVPVITYVTPSGGRAASAGFFLLEAGDVAAMAPGTNTGAATPVMIAGTPDPVMMKKVENDARASLRSLVERRKRNSALAEKTVSESRSFTEQEALKDGLIDLVARDTSDLLAQVNGRDVERFSGEHQHLDVGGARVIVYERSLRQKIQVGLSNPTLALAILLLGAVGLYLEFTTPGAVVPGVAGGILLLVGLTAFSVIPVTWTGVGLILLALTLFALEAIVTSHGVLGIGGAVALVLGAMLLVDSPAPEMRIGFGSALGLALPFAAITLFLATLVVQARRRPPETGREALVGMLARTMTPLAPEGVILLRGETWSARSAVPVPEGKAVRVLKVQGLEAEVEPVDSDEPQQQI
ncbi:MAG: nodulation protein NfeD [Bryobacterales bacterium]|nr:nodulation protein NfeD [Bryobacterales bacterium]